MIGKTKYVRYTFRESLEITILPESDHAVLYEGSSEKPGLLKLQTKLTSPVKQYTV